ncbi:uncharacterized protein LOC125030015 [Penaeus chinensis]|uniref:uncharacterized protein LOC125030015 n=1 Tax=Penaeus chinensis TaxID=139456 RepID=UPI001FB727F5|nr:uncharacterized protein LOC125030015 [Penaeus chinensis]
MKIKDSQCVRTETGLHPDGSTWYLEGCRMAECSRDGNMMRIIYYSCGKVGTLDGCEMVEDHTLNYPDCCPKDSCS